MGLLDVFGLATQLSVIATRPSVSIQCADDDHLGDDNLKKVQVSIRPFSIVIVLLPQLAEATNSPEARSNASNLSLRGRVFTTTSRLLVEIALREPTR
jgi:hypothetical protein